MGLLIDGIWKDHWYDTKTTKGEFIRQTSQFRNWVTADGHAGPTGKSGFKAEPNRYHLYVSLACPWAHRTLIFRHLKKLEKIITVSIVDWFMGENGWTFLERDGATGDPINNTDYLWQVYVKANPNYTGRVTVPILWDKQEKTIVSNESADIIRIFNNAFNALGDEECNFYPSPLQQDIDAINKKIYTTINNGVYKCGFATTQEAYDNAFEALFSTLDELNIRLANQPYLIGKTLTEADWRLFTTLLRFDPVYVGHFKCNLRRIADYPNLSNYLRSLYQMPDIAETVNFRHIKNHYYVSHTTINPTGIVPNGPIIDLDAPHDRDRFNNKA